MSNMHRAVSAACAGPGRGGGAGVPHPKRPRKDSHSLPSGWPFGDCRFVFLPGLAASRLGERTSRAAPRAGVLGGRVLGAGLGIPRRGRLRWLAQDTVPPERQITNRNAVLDGGYASEGFSCCCQGRGYFLKRADTFAYAEER